jgi:hypothetical protein
MDERTPRSAATRDTAKRPVYHRQSALPTPDPKPGLTYRWIRTSTQGNSDNANVSRRFREGYVPVKASDHPEMKILADVDSRFPGHIEVGGLMLCAAPTENVEDRVAHQNDQTQAQMDAVDRNYMRESHPRMPVLPTERSTRVSKFGA